MQRPVCEQLIVTQIGTIHKVPCPQATPATYRLVILTTVGADRHQPQEFYVCNSHRTQFLAVINPTDSVPGEPILLKEVQLT
jgi:hypothetical protein